MVIITGQLESAGSKQVGNKEGSCGGDPRWSWASLIQPETTSKPHFIKN